MRIISLGGIEFYESDFKSLIKVGKTNEPEQRQHHQILIAAAGGRAGRGPKARALHLPQVREGVSFLHPLDEVPGASEFARYGG